MAKKVMLRKILRHAFPGMQDPEADLMIQSGKVMNYPAKTCLCKEGALEDTFYILLEGEVQVTKTINDSEERLMKVLCQGDFFGEMAIIHAAPRAASVTTSTPVTVLEIQKEAFSALLERTSSMSIAMVREVSRRLRENDAMAIDDLREKARELAEAYQQLAEQDFARREFLTTIAHELRTPLMAANGFLQIIRTGKLQGEALQSALDTVGRNLQEIITLTNDILFLQEMELILSEFTPTDVGGVVSSCVDLQRERAELNNVDISLSVASGRLTLPGDAKSLGRAINAILDNAIKFSPEGGEVKVEVGQTPEEVWIRIQDRGVGIPASVLPKVFDRFFHLDEVGGHLFRGAGLGLSIARQVIQQHHGTIEVDSQLGIGSTFTIHLRRPG